MAVVSATPKVAKSTPCAAMGLISLYWVSIPPENNIILSAIIPMNCALLGLSNCIPIPSLPNSIPTPKNKSNTGTPKRNPAFPAIILKNNHLSDLDNTFINIPNLNL